MPVSKCFLNPEIHIQALLSCLDRHSNIDGLSINFGIAPEVAHLSFWGYLFKRNGSRGKYATENPASLYTLAITIGLHRAASVFVYGFAVPKLGKCGSWPITLVVGLASANMWGFLIVGWKLANSRPFTGIMLHGMARPIHGDHGTEETLALNAALPQAERAQASPAYGR